MHESRFQGGPLDGDTLTVRSSVAVLAVDGSAELVWKYTRPDPNDPSVYHLDFFGPEVDQSTGSRPLDEQTLINSAEAGMDIITAYGDEPTQDEIEAEEDLTDGE